MGGGGDGSGSGGGGGKAGCDRCGADRIGGCSCLSSRGGCTDRELHTSIALHASHLPHVRCMHNAGYTLRCFYLPAQGRHLLHACICHFASMQCDTVITPDGDLRHSSPEPISPRHLLSHASLPSPELTVLACAAGCMGHACGQPIDG